MIRINLLKNRGEVTKATAATEVNYDGIYEELSNDEGAKDPKTTALKVFCMLGALGLLIIYESYNIGQIRGQINDATALKNKLAKEIQEKKPIAEQARDLQKKIQDLEGRITSIKNLSKYRLREIKAIDFIQREIPERVWLTSLDFKDETIKIEGGSITDDELSKFLDSLDGKSYFRDVRLSKAIEEKRKDGTIKVFEILGNLTNTD